MPSELDKRHAYTFRQGGYPIHSNSQMLLDKPLECYPLDKEWQKRINRSCRWASGYTGPEKGSLKEVKLIKKLLSFGGYEACMAYNEPDADAILERGQL